MSYINEHRDILTRGLWTSDPLLIYESNVLQTFRPGNIRKKRNQETRERDQTIDEIVEVNIPRVDLDVNDIEDEINKGTYFEVFEIIL